METTDFLKGFNFSSKEEFGGKRRTPATHDGVVIYSAAGEKRRFNRYEINFMNFFIRIGKEFSSVAIGARDKDILFVFDTPEMRAESLNLAPSTKALNSRDKVLTIFSTLGVKPKTAPGAHNVLYFKLVHAFGNIYHAEFDLPEREGVEPKPSAKVF